ncbi:YihY/virulence factor BrkB family protein [Flavobacterium sp.]|uniref:YihY/virulence factor BrkB family protein n=1 Tax=Flavobacterium sp. TaxID=239 RepID=UPI00262286A0|nr:YihY/virulence factor BrkB family protein [Flavobacterium sp.]
MLLQDKPLSFEKWPVLKPIISFLDRWKLGFMGDLSLYRLLKIYGVGIAESAVSYRAGAIAWSFFMALFPFALFVLNLIPFIPIPNFQDDFLEFVAGSVPPNTYDAISVILFDIMNNSNSSLLSSGFLLAIFLQANGVNAILGGFEHSKYYGNKRSFFRQYFVAMGISFLLIFFLILTVSGVVVFEVFVQKSKIQSVISDRIQLLEIGRYLFLALMIFLTVSTLLKYGARRSERLPFFSIGSVVTTLIVILTSFLFGIWVEKFAQYNELYGSIGTLLILMFYIWLNSMILLLGFELNAVIRTLKRENT